MSSQLSDNGLFLISLSQLKGRAKVATLHLHAQSLCVFCIVVVCISFLPVLSMQITSHSRTQECNSHLLSWHQQFLLSRSGSTHLVLWFSFSISQFRGARATSATATCVREWNSRLGRTCSNFFLVCRGLSTTAACFWFFAFGGHKTFSHFFYVTEHNTKSGLSCFIEPAKHFPTYRRS